MGVGVLSSGSGMIVTGTARACCAVYVSGVAFGCAGAPCNIFSCTGDARIGSFTLIWGTSAATSGTVSGKKLVGLVLVKRVS